MDIKVRNIALFVLPVIAGATFPDIDHLFEGQARTWGHDWHYPCFILAIVAIAYIGRWIKTRVLR